MRDSGGVVLGAGIIAGGVIAANGMLTEKPFLRREAGVFIATSILALLAAAGEGPGKVAAALAALAAFTIVAGNLPEIYERIGGL